MILTCNVPQIYIARLLQGFGVGFVMTAQTMYVGEISSDDCRGALGSFMQVGIVTGILFVYAIGPYVSFVALQYICLTLPILFIVTFFFMPDSPHFYISKGRKADAIKSLKFLRGKSTEGIQEELDIIQASVEESMKNKGSVADIFNNSGNVKGKIIWKAFCCDENWKLFLFSFDYFCRPCLFPTTFGNQRRSFLQSIDLWKSWKFDGTSDRNNLRW